MEALNEAAWRLRVRRAGSSTEVKVSMCPPRSEADTSILQLSAGLKMSWPDAYIARGGVRDAQKRLGKTHQRNTFLG
jgi:hypothetical protein